jgi:glycosyltransferase involved in cell wall biosynthesis
MRRPWEALAHRLGIADAARFPGQVPYAEVPTYLNAMDVVVAPFAADRGETSPFKILDAMACGRPVVASALPSVKPLADASGAVALVRPDDPDDLAAALASLLADPTRRQAMGDRGRAFVLAHHAWDRIAERLLAAL